MADFILISLFLIIAGYWCLLGIRNTLITVILALELIFMGIALFFIILSFYLDDMNCQIFALTILVTAAAESTIALSIFVAYQRLKLPMFVTFFNKLAG